MHTSLECTASFTFPRCFERREDKRGAGARAGIAALASEMTNTGNMSGTTVAYLSSEGKYIFSSATSFTLRPNTLEMATLLGFANNITVTSTLASADPIYVNNSTYTGK